MTTSNNHIPLGAVVLALAIHALWGGNPVAIKWGLEVFPPFWSGFVRFAIGTACVAVWAYAQQESLWPERTDWPALVTVSLLFSAQIWTMNVGYGGTSGSLGALLMALNPIFAVLMARFFIQDDRLSWRRAAGLACAFTGTAVVLSPETHDGARELTRLANWIVGFSAFLLGARLMYSARIIRQQGETRVMFWMMCLSLPVFAGGGALFETIAWDNMNWRPISGLIYQGIAIAGIAFTVNSYLMRKYSPSVVVSFNFVSPVVGVLLSIWLLNEPLGTALVLGMGLVAIGLTLIARR